MNLQEIKELMELFDASGLGSLKIKDEEFSIKLEKPRPAHMPPPHHPMMEMYPVGGALGHGEAPPTPPPVEVADTSTPVTAPLVGVFYVAPSPDAPPCVKVGDRVNKGDVVGFIEAMKMITELEAPVSGVIKEIRYKNEDLLGFGDVIMRIEG